MRLPRPQEWGHVQGKRIHSTEQREPLWFVVQIYGAATTVKSPIVMYYFPDFRSTSELVAEVPGDVIVFRSPDTEKVTEQRLPGPIVCSCRYPFPVTIVLTVLPACTSRRRTSLPTAPSPVLVGTTAMIANGVGSGIEWWPPAARRGR